MLQNVKHKAYFDEINLMKGLAMFLAVVGHALPDATNGFNIVGGIVRFLCIPLDLLFPHVRLLLLRRLPIHSQTALQEGGRDDRETI